MMAFTNDWLAENNPEPNEVVGGESLGRGIGMCQFNWRGLNINALVMPYRIFMLQRIQDAHDAPARGAVDVLFAETGLSALVTTRSTRRVERENHREIWR